MKWLKQIYYYLFCSHELRWHNKYYVCYDNGISIELVIKCQKCGKILSQMQIGEYFTKNEEQKQQIIQKLEAKGIKKYIDNN